VLDDDGDGGDRRSEDCGIESREYKEEAASWNMYLRLARHVLIPLWAPKTPDS
jgi:hypothetical protein